MAATKRPVHEHSSPVDTSAYTDTDIARFFGALGVPADKVDALIAERHTESRPPPTVSDPARHR